MKTILAPFLLLILAIGTGCGEKNGGDPVTPPPPPPPPPPPVVTTKSYYVSDGNGSDANAGTTMTAPFKSIARGYNAAAAGDTVFVMNGTYNGASTTLLNLTKSGEAGKYITIKAMTGHTPKLFVFGNVWNAVIVNANYIVLEGLEVQGNADAINSTDAMAAYNEAKGGGTNWTHYSQFNTNGILIGGPRTDTKFPHHIVIRNCKVWDFPGGGVQAIQTDYNTIEGNTIWDNGWYMMYAGSGISILNPFNFDMSTETKNFIRNNIVYGNKTTIPWVSTGSLSDGNGIILDVNRTPYSGTGPAYTGRTRVENNVVYNNGGSGIHCFKADHVDIINNTSFSNSQVLAYGEIFSNNCADVKIFNNIMYARTGGKVNTNFNNVNVTHNNNVYFNGTIAVQGAGDKVANPGFVSPSVNPATADFRLTGGSPAVDAGTSALFPAKDILGVSRPKGAGVDIGAYEF